jgi:cystathionine gamma-synthase
MGDRRSPFSPPEDPRPDDPHWTPTTRAIVAGRPRRTGDAPLNEPVAFASNFHAGGPVAYSRDGNPSWSALEEVLGSLEGGEAVSFASGMAAVSAVFEQVPVGAAVVLPRDGYYGTRAFLDATVPGRFEPRLVDIADTAATVTACEGAALLWIESPTNPLLDVADIPALARAAHAGGALVAVDNTYMTPLGQRPLELGADVVVHSVSKMLAGHSDLILGAAVARAGSGLCDRLRRRRSMAGAIPGPMEAYLALRGIRTLPLRYRQAQDSAGELARRLASHPEVVRLRYPGLADDRAHERARAQLHGFGNMIAFEVRGGPEAAEAAACSTRLVVHATSLGGIETSIERRARWPGESAPASLLRLSVGCEDLEDLWRDLDHALSVAGSVRHGLGDRVALPGRRPATQG